MVAGRRLSQASGGQAVAVLAAGFRAVLFADQRAGRAGGSGHQVVGGGATALRAWSVRLLAYLHAPVIGRNDPRVAFLERWARVEGTFAAGNWFNPLDTEMPAAGASLWNRNGVRRYRSLSQGLAATRATMALPVNRPVLVALRSRQATMDTLGLALARADWTGQGQASWVEQSYASRVSGRPLRSFGLPLPTESIRGVVVDALWRPLAGVCVTALSHDASPRQVTTATNGSFDLAGLPHASYRLELAPCRPGGGAGRTAAGPGGPAGGSPSFYDASAQNLRTANPHRATPVGFVCSELASCPAEQLRLHHPIELGQALPAVTWPTPSSVAYGTPLSAAQLDATSSVRGTFRYDPPLGTHLAAGPHQLRAQLLPANPGAFAPVTITRTLTVRPALPQLFWPTPSPLPAGRPVTARQLDALALAPAPSPPTTATTATTATAATAVGPARTPLAGTMHYSVLPGTLLASGRHLLTVTFVPADTRDYAVARAVVLLVVRRPPAARRRPAGLAGVVGAADPVVTTTPAAATPAAATPAGSTPAGSTPATSPTATATGPATGTGSGTATNSGTVTGTASASGTASGPGAASASGTVSGPGTATISG